MHPKSNGLAERFNRTMVTYIRKYIENSTSWDQLLPSLQASYNNTPHSSTKVSPYSLVYGRLPTVPSSLLAPSRNYYGQDEGIVLFKNFEKFYKLAKEGQEQAFRKQKAEFDKKSYTKELKKGNIVYITRSHTGQMFQKFQPLFSGPFRVLAVSNKNNVQIQHCKTFKISIVHLNRIKMAPYLEQHLDLSKKIDEEERKKLDYETHKQVKEKEREKMIRETKQYQRERKRKEERVKIGTTPKDIVHDEEEEIQSESEEEESPPPPPALVQQNDPAAQPVIPNVVPPPPAKLPVQNPPGILTRGLMRAVGLKPIDITIPKRPQEYKKYTPRKK